jgi:hypothetical protein
MECPSCGTENKPDAVFCMSCGAPLPDMPFSQLAREEARRPPAEDKGPAPPPGGAGSQVSPGGEAFRQASPEPPPQPAPPRQRAEAASPPPPAPAPQVRAQAPTAAQPAQAPAPPPPGQASPAPPKPSAEEHVAEETVLPGPEYYLPPEVDRVVAPRRQESAPREEPPVRETPPPAAAPSLDSTQAVAPVIAPSGAVVRERKVVCPECYAPNPEVNAYCQECGSTLPVTGTRQSTAVRPAPVQPASRQTAVLTPASQADEGALPAYASPLPRAEKTYGSRSFGAADILAVFAAGAVTAAIALSYVLESFTWKRGLDIMLFSHQGAYTQGRTDLLGGPGILPYEGTEFFTVGLVAAMGLALALIFLAVRVGRGPMYLLSGCMLLFPAAYLFFQAILPLRQMGIDVDPSVGLSGMFFGNAANPGAGPPMWIIAGAGAMLVAAGFIAPPRGWGRLFTFLLCFGIILAAAFFCAACFNWNLFISQTAGISSGAGPLLLHVKPCLGAFLL